MILPADEELHCVGPGRYWQESWYFNWADGESFGLARLGYRLNERRIDALVLTIRDGEPELIYPGVGLRDGGGERDAARGLRGGRLVVTMLEPLRRWRIVLEGRDALELTFEATTPAHDYHGEGRRLPPGVAAGHFEQAGRVTGWTRLRGRERRVNGTGERDKSWGERDWSRVERWDWIAGQFGDGFAFNVWQGSAGGEAGTSGYVWDGGVQRAVTAVEVRYQWGRRAHLARRAELRVAVEGGGSYDLVAEALGTFPLLRGRLWIEETHARFRCGGRAGVGVIEHAWRAGALDIARRAGDLARVAARVLRS